MKRLWHDYSLGWVLLALFLVSWVIQTWTGWREFESEQRSHQESAEVFGADGYVWRWGEATFENWQSEFLQLLAFASLTSFLIFKGSPESRDSDDEMKATLARMEKRLEELQSNVASGAPSADGGAALKIPSAGTTT